MPAKNPRLNVLLERPLYDALGRLARREGASLSIMARDLLRDALERYEDLALAKLTVRSRVAEASEKAPGQVEAAASGRAGRARGRRRVGRRHSRTRRGTGSRRARDASKRWFLPDAVAPRRRGRRSADPTRGLRRLPVPRSTPAPPGAQARRSGARSPQGSRHAA